MKHSVGVFVILCVTILSHYNINTYTYDDNLPRPTTYDESFEDQFQVEHIRDGDGVTFTKEYSYVKVKFKGFIPATGQVFDSTDMRGGWYVYQRRAKLVTVLKIPYCLAKSFEHMTRGEKIIIICESDHAFGSHGYIDKSKILVKPNETVGYEIEMVDSQWDPYEFQLVKPGKNIKI